MHACLVTLESTFLVSAETDSKDLKLSLENQKIAFFSLENIRVGFFFKDFSGKQKDFFSWSLRVTARCFH